MPRCSSDLHTHPVTGRIRRDLLAWYEATRRDFPWRGTHDPYAVLVSEVMLQQTQLGGVGDLGRGLGLSGIAVGAIGEDVGREDRYAIPVRSRVHR